MNQKYRRIYAMNVANFFWFGWIFYIFYRFDTEIDFLGWGTLLYAGMVFTMAVGFFFLRKPILGYGVSLNEKISTTVLYFLPVAVSYCSFPLLHIFDLKFHLLAEFYFFEIFLLAYILATEVNAVKK